MGDVAMTVPVVYSLAKQYPELRISVLSRPFAKAFFTGLSKNVDFIAADLKSEYKGIKGLNQLYGRLKAKQPTAIADFHDVLRTKYIRTRFLLSGYKVAHIDKHKSGKRKLCRKTHKVMEQQPTSFHNYAEVLSKLGYPINISFTSLFANGGNQLSQLPNMIGEKPDGERWIGIAPFAAHGGKMYPKDKMEEVVNTLSASYTSLRIFFFGGGKEEKQVLNMWATKYKHCICASEVLHGLHDELALMSHLDVMISMDSANMHLASLVGTRVVSIWGATHPYCGFLGWNQKTEDAVQNTKLECRPCSVFGNKPCYRADFECMQSIAPNTIIERINL